ncbi:MAG: hypothetical protein ABJC66_04145 [Gammaproteobacteria bacterium]
MAAAPAIADGNFADMLSYSGFGTVGLARSDTEQAVWVQNIQTFGATNKNFDYRTDSKLAVQGTIAPAQWLSGTAQVLTEERYGPGMSTQFEWAFVKVKPLPDLSVRAGRMELPTFLISDTRNVGYANLWLRAPDEVYGQPIFDVYNGYDVTYQHDVGPYPVSFNVLAGTSVSETALAPGVQRRIIGHKLLGYNATLDLNGITIRVSRITTDRTHEEYGITYPALSWSFDSVGVIYDRRNIVLQSEFIERRTSNPSINVNGMYLLGGYHLGKWTPYVMYSRGETLGGGNGTVPFASMHVVTGGARLDAFRNVDFKVQIEHAAAYQGGTPFENQSATFGNVGNVFSFVVDFVF